MKKPTPPAYAIGMDPSDYCWDAHRFVECEEGGCSIPLEIEKHNTTTGDHTMATAKKINTPAKTSTSKTTEKTDVKASKKTETPKKEKVKEEKEEVERKPKFAATIISLVADQDKTDDEIAEIVAEDFPDKKDLLGSIKWYRSAHNRKAAQAGEDEFEEIVLDDNGKHIPKSKKAPVEKVSKKSEEKTAPDSTPAKTTKANTKPAAKADASAQKPVKKPGKK